MERKYDARHYGTLIAWSILLLLGISGCTKLEGDAPITPFEGILFPFRLTNTIEDQSTMMPRSMFIDSRKQKWITYSTQSGNTGIIRFDGNLGDNYPNATTDLPLYFDGNLMVQTEDANGAVYFTTNAGNYFSFRLLRYQAGVWAFWEVEGIPCSEIYFNANDGKLYFVFLDQVHRIDPNSNFSDPTKYEKINFNLPGSPLIIQSNFDGQYIHFLSEYRYYVIDTNGEVLFYTTKFSDINFTYFFASDPNTAAYTLGGASRQHLYKLHEGRWARYPLSDISLSSITVDEQEGIYVNAIAPDYSVGKYQDGEILYFTYGTDQKRVMSSAPVVVDKSNVKWVAVPEGLVRLP